MASSFDRALIHPHAEVRAGAWTTSPAALYSHGWKMEVVTRDLNRTLYVGLRSPAGMVTAMEMDGFRTRHIEMMEHKGVMVLYFNERAVISNEVGVFRQMQVWFDPGDMMNLEVGRMGGEPYNGNSFMHLYQPIIKSEPQEIIVTPEKIPMLLEEIRKAQEPRARELLHKHHQQDDLRKLEQKATILTFARA
jgi:hypothetical protein